jgi:Arc/MetJ-type ribon-helix-helix transcriptional regulator
MGKTTQVAFQLDDESLAKIDALVTTQYRSRAEVIRIAVHDWLARKHSEQVDAALARGYEVAPTGAEEDAWAELSVQGLRAGDLDW